MNELKINNSPVRTSRNYQINHIKVESMEWKTNSKFDNIAFQDFDDKNVILKKMTSEICLTYGMGMELENEIKDNANVKYKIELINNTEAENIIHFSFDEENEQLVDDIEIIVNENVKGNITIKYDIKKDDDLAKYQKNKKVRGLHNGIIRISLKKNAVLNMTVVNLVGYSTEHFLAMQNHLNQNAKLIYNIVDFGGNHSVTNYYSDLEGTNSENTLNTIYIGADEQFFDMNYIAATKGSQSKVHIDVQGALKDFAKKHFKGTIDFKRGAKKAEGSENEFCMLLSDDARSISLPMLLCDEEDVVGTHASAAGKVNNKELFYLMSRGLTEKEAKTLLVKAKFNQVMDNITNEELKEEILAEIDSRLL